MDTTIPNGSVDDWIRTIWRKIHGREPREDEWTALSRAEDAVGELPESWPTRRLATIHSAIALYPKRERRLVKIIRRGNHYLTLGALLALPSIGRIDAGAILRHSYSERPELDLTAQDIQDRAVKLDDIETLETKQFWRNPWPHFSPDEMCCPVTELINREPSHMTALSLLRHAVGGPLSRSDPGSFYLTRDAALKFERSTTAPAVLGRASTISMDRHNAAEFVRKATALTFPDGHALAGDLCFPQIHTDPINDSVTLGWHDSVPDYTGTPFPIETRRYSKGNPVATSRNRWANWIATLLGVGVLSGATGAAEVPGVFEVLSTYEQISTVAASIWRNIEAIGLQAMGVIALVFVALRRGRTTLQFVYLGRWIGRALGLTRISS